MGFIQSAYLLKKKSQYTDSQSFELFSIIIINYKY